MNKNEFFVAVKDAVASRTSGSVVLSEVMKNNDQLLHGLTIKGDKVSPCVYLDEYYSDYEKGATIEDIAVMVVSLIEREAPPSSLINYDFSLLRDFENVRARLRFRVVNREKNSGFLADVPHVDFLDLSRVYYIDMGDVVGDGAVVKIANKWLEIWGVTAADIDELALENTAASRPIDINSMEDVLRSFGALAGEDVDLDDLDEIVPAPMYVATCSDSCFGSYVICFDSLLMDFAKKVNSDFYILPSSVHELIFVPVEEALPPDAFKSMIQTVNRTDVSPDEVLSDSLYIFKRSDGRVQIA